MQKQSQSRMKKQNEWIVLELIRQAGPISRIEIAKTTKMSPTTVTRIVQDLEKKDYIEEKYIAETAIGRRPTLVGLREDGRFSVGVHFDRSNIRIGIVDFIGRLTAFKEISLDEATPYEEYLDTLVAELEEMISEDQIPPEKILGIGIGVPGVVNPDAGIIVTSEQLQWRNRPLVRDLSGKIGMDVIIDNELKMRIYAENADFQEEDRNCILIGIGTGVGASIMLNGEVYRGMNNNSGEIAHMNINPAGDRCNCGNQGCLSTFVAERALIRKTGGRIQSINELLSAIRADEQWALELEDEYMTAVAIAVNTLACTFEPRTIIISSPLISTAQSRHKLKSFCERLVWSEMWKHLNLEFSKLQETGVVLGAARQVQNLLLKV